jgi:phosphatidyl-myo-inositol dimannoside synthase
MRARDVLVVTPDFPPDVGGIQRLAERVATNLSGFSVRVQTLAPMNGAAAGPAGFPVHRVLRVGPVHPAHIGLLNASAAWCGLRHRPAVVLNLHVATAPSAVALTRFCGVPYVQVIYGKELARRPRLVRAALRYADTVVAVSNWTADVARSSWPSIQPVVIPGGVDLPGDRHSPRSQSPTIITVSRLSDRYKGHDVMLRALPLVADRVPDVRWVVVGDGPLRALYAAVARGLGVSSRVTFTGRVSDTERDRLLSEAWVFAMISRLTRAGAGEGFGIVYLEAAARGLPVVAGDVAGARDAVIRGQTGLLVDPNNPAAVAEVLVRLLTDQTLADRMGRAGRKFAERHSWRDIADRYGSVLNDILFKRAAT